MSDQSQTKFLTGIRAYAALWVLVIHTGGAGLSALGSWGTNISNFGKYGVIIFFVLSAFTICLSLSKDSRFNFRKYAMRRVFRIYPIYAAVITLSAIVGLLTLTNPSFMKELFYHLTFLNLFVLKYRNSLVSVEWTIPIEVFYYLLLPTVFYYISRNKARVINVVLVGLLITFAGSIFVLPYYEVDNLSLSRHYSVEAYAFTYACGVALFFLYQHLKQLQMKFNSWHLLGTLVVLFLYAQLPGRSDLTDVLFATVWTCALILICGSNVKLSKLLFENRFAMYLGTISYSFYLVHFLVLRYLPETWGSLMTFVVTFGITLVISSITYYAIEKVYIDLGRRLEKGLNSRG